MAHVLVTVVVAISVGLGVADGAVPSDAVCKERARELDVAVSNLTMLINEHVIEYPTIEDFEQKYCIPFTGWYKTVLQYKPCLKAFTQSLFNFMTSSMKKMHKKFCTTPAKREVAFNHIKCMNRKSKPVFMKTGRQVKNYAEFLSELDTVDDIIPTFCCGYLNVSVELTNRIEKECQRQGRPGSGIFIADVVKNMIADPVDIVCGAYTKPSDCQTKRLKPIMAAMQERAVSRTSFNYESLIPPVLIIVSKLDSELTVD